VAVPVAVRGSGCRLNKALGQVMKNDSMASILSFPGSYAFVFKNPFIGVIYCSPIHVEFTKIIEVIAWT